MGVVLGDDVSAIIVFYDFVQFRQVSLTMAESQESHLDVRDLFCHCFEVYLDGQFLLTIFGIPTRSLTYL